jgi:hypothetical protein
MKGSTVKRKKRRITRLGELVTAAFEGAARYSTDPEEVARLASGVVSLIMRTGCRQAVLSALRTRKDTEGIHLDWPQDESIQGVLE